MRHKPTYPKQTFVSLSEEQVNKMKEIAEEEDRSLSATVRQAVAFFLESRESDLESRESDH